MRIIEIRWTRVLNIRSNATYGFQVFDKFVSKSRIYLQNHGCYNHSANIAINIYSMTPDLFEHLLHAISRMKDGTFIWTPKLESIVHVLLRYQKMSGFRQAIRRKFRLWIFSSIYWNNTFLMNWSTQLIFILLVFWKTNSVLTIESMFLSKLQFQRRLGQLYDCCIHQKHHFLLPVMQFF